VSGRYGRRLDDRRIFIRDRFAQEEVIPLAELAERKPCIVRFKSSVCHSAPTATGDAS
jgi:hypothetical protein